MNPELYWIYLFNIIINSILSFYSSVLLVSLFVYFLRIKNPRVQSFCYLLPFCKIWLDLFFYCFSSWALAFNVNPLLALTGTRTLRVQIDPFFGIQFCMQNGQTFSLADVVALSIGLFWVRVIVISIGSGAVIALILCWVRFVRDGKRINRIIQNALPIHRFILNPKLKSWVNKMKVQFVASPEIHSPCVARKKLLFPSSLIDVLSQQEFEAIIVHEMTHLRCKDCIIRLMCWLISAVFWWIPTQWWRKRVEELQEKSSDQAIYQFEISKFALAEAVLKAARNTQVSNLRSVISFIENRTILTNRMQTILQQEPTQRTLGGRTIQYGLLGLSLCSILFGKMWIF